MRRRRTAGQSIVEYLIVAAALIAAVAGVAGLLQARTTNVMTNAINQIP